MTVDKPSVAVIGAGIIGVTSAAYLIRQGYEVTLFDDQGIGESTSSGNAGAFAYVDIYPLPQPSMLLKAPKWFFDPLGPLSIPLGYMPKIIPWLSGFLLACRPAQVKKGIETMKGLMTLSRTQAAAFWLDWDMSAYIVKHGSLNLYESVKAFEKDKQKWLDSEQQDFEIEFLEGAEIQQLEPAIDSRFCRAVRVFDWPLVNDPKVYTKAVGNKVIDAGASLVERRIVQIKADADKVNLVDQAGEHRQFDKAVIAIGSWSNLLTAQLGDKLPLDAERGYNTTIADSNIHLDHMLLFPEYGFVASPLACGLRIGGANELAGTDYPPNYKRAEHLLDKAKQFLPGLNSEGGTQWMGRRPSLADTQPLIDYSSASKNVVYAFGHGHYGLTQSAATGKLVSELIDQKPLSVDIDGIKLKRFK